MIVVDASALTAFVLREEGWETIAGHLTVASSVEDVAKEVSNAIWKACLLRGFISVEDATRAHGILQSMLAKNIRLYRSVDLLDDAFKISLQHRLTVYDSVYLALALREGADLLTLDEGQAGVAEELGIRVIP